MEKFEPKDKSLLKDIFKDVAIPKIVVNDVYNLIGGKK